MKRLGGYMALAGILLIVLPKFGLTLMFLGKVEELGETTSWAIKIGLILVGAILFFMATFGTKKIIITAKDSTE